MFEVLDELLELVWRSYDVNIQKVQRRGRVVKTSTILANLRDGDVPFWARNRLKAEIPGAPKRTHKSHFRGDTASHHPAVHCKPARKLTAKICSMSLNIRPAVTSSPDYPFFPISAAVKLDQNESSEDFPAQLKAIVLERIAAQEWNRYPDLHSEALCSAIGRHDGWEPSGIVATTGSNVLISLLIQLTALDSRVVTVKPNFALYGLDAKLLGVELTEIPLLSDFSVDVPGVLNSLEGPRVSPDKPRGVIYIPRPHAPTGTVIALKDLDHLVAHASDWLVVVDEAYHHFASGDALLLASKYPNVVVIRTFSKAWGLAGVRMGYGLTSPVIAMQLRKLVPPFAISFMQSECIRVALENPGYMQQRVARAKVERERMTTALLQHQSWKVFPSEGNFILIRTPNASAAYTGLLKQGILARRQDSYFGLEGCIRVTVGTIQENDAFLRAAFSLK